jgi:hypothetical protein
VIRNNANQIFLVRYPSGYQYLHLRANSYGQGRFATAASFRGSLVTDCLEVTIEQAEGSAIKARLEG